MAEAPNVPIGELRWLVTLVTRAQAPQSPGTGIDEPDTAPQMVHASVVGVGFLAFWGQAGEQTEGPVTHRITMRWLDYLPNTDAILRTTTLRDGTQRTERFRVRRTREITGRKRFVIAECELEVVT